MFVLETVHFMVGDKAKTGHPIRLFVYVWSKVSGDKELEETLVADGPSP